MIIEDDPYWYLQYPSAAALEASARRLPPPKSPVHTFARSSGFPYLDSLVPSYLNIDTDGRVIRLDTFSKTVAPGCRLGWVTAQPAIIERLLRITECSTQQPSGFVQSMIAELVMGQQPEAKAEFLRKSKADQKAFAGWQVGGWVRWLEGLRGSYERRMNRMCTILEDGRFQLKQGTPLKPSESDWAVISKTQMYSFNWPRGGMFVWVRVHFETHPLAGQVPGAELSRILWVFFTQKPHLLLLAPGDMFSASKEIKEDRGWQYYRMCFAAVSEEDVDRCSERFAGALNAFWAIKSKKELDDVDKEDAFDAAELVNLGAGLGC
jgi:DNA-binding transcriptional MocR family regulator